jgi:hypothetical protein
MKFRNSSFKVSFLQFMTTLCVALPLPVELIFIQLVFSESLGSL